jgi:hypothetical protein
MHKKHVSSFSSNAKILANLAFLNIPFYCNFYDCGENLSYGAI